MPELNLEHETLVDEEIKHGDEEGVEAAKLLLTSKDPGDVTQDEAAADLKSKSINPILDVQPLLKMENIGQRKQI